MTRFVILLDGEAVSTPRLVSYCNEARIIAADGGIRLAKEFNLQPELWVGDFDSSEPIWDETYRSIPRQCFPVEKDKTDGQLAIEAALQAGATELVLLGAFGGRFDHVFMHMALAVAMAQRNVKIILTSGYEEAQPIFPGDFRFDWPLGTVFSLLPFVDLKNLTIDGAKWPLQNFALAFGTTHSLSNQVIGELKISLSQGYGIIFSRFL